MRYLGPLVLTLSLSACGDDHPTVAEEFQHIHRHVTAERRIAQLEHRVEMLERMSERYGRELDRINSGTP